MLNAPAGLTVDFTLVEPSAMLGAWSWLLPHEATPILVTALGNVFLQVAGGRVAWLDVGAAELSVVAESLAEFQALLQTADRIEEWFVPDLVAALRAREPLGQGQCYSFKIPPTLGGQLEPANFHVLNVATHLAGMGKIQVQVIDLPLGTEIRAVKLEEDDA